MKTYVSTIIEENNKFLLVKEAKKQCYGKWGFPSGHVEEDEYIFDAATREVKEETNLEVELNGLIAIYNNMFEGFNSISFVFSSKLNNNNNNKLIARQGEILEIKWFSFDEIKDIRKELRDTNYMIDSIEKYNNKNIKPLEIIVTR